MKIAIGMFMVLVGVNVVGAIIAYIGSSIVPKEASHVGD
jgi:hypothetical protein